MTSWHRLLVRLLLWPKGSAAAADLTAWIELHIESLRAEGVSGLGIFTAVVAQVGSIYSRGTAQDRVLHEFGCEDLAPAAVEDEPKRTEPAEILEFDRRAQYRFERHAYYGYVGGGACRLDVARDLIESEAVRLKIQLIATKCDADINGSRELRLLYSRIVAGRIHGLVLRSLEDLPVTADGLNHLVNLLSVQHVRLVCVEDGLDTDRHGYGPVIAAMRGVQGATRRSTGMSLDPPDFEEHRVGARKMIRTGAQS